MHCARHEFTGLSVDGGFADYVVVPERSLIKLPEGIAPADVAPHSDAGLTAYHAVRKLAHLAEPGTTAVVIGVGGVGHIAMQLVRELGSSSVIAVDSDHRRRALAKELGADHVLDAPGSVDAVRELTEGRGADLVFDFVGIDQTHADGTAMVARGGTYSIVGYGGMVSFPSVALVVGENAVVGNLVGNVDRPLGAAPAPRSRAGHAQDRDAPSRRRERRPRRSPRGRSDRPRWCLRLPSVSGA